MILLELFWSFCKIGFTSFGGLSMVPLINSEMLSHGWMTLSEVSDIVAIAEMTPGPLGLNCATFAGTRVAGLAGAVSASLGVLSPTLLICAAAAVMFEKFRESDFMKKVMYGIRPACLGPDHSGSLLIDRNQLHERRRQHQLRCGSDRRGRHGPAAEI